jgi:hypothetical protein
MRKRPHGLAAQPFTGEKTRRVESAGLSSDRGVSFGRPRSVKGYSGAVKKSFIALAAAWAAIRCRLRFLTDRRRRRARRLGLSRSGETGVLGDDCGRVSDWQRNEPARILAE